MKSIQDAFTENDNKTYCVIRILGATGVFLVGVSAIIGAAPLEVGAGIAAIITSIGGGLKLKGEK